MVRPDVIIPVYKPDHKFEKVIEMLLRQTIRPQKLILMVTCIEGCGAEEIARRVEGVANRCDSQGTGRVSIEIARVKKEDYDHGGTRNLAISRYSTAPYVLCMTQDAVPADIFLVERLLACFSEERIGAAYARQLAENGASFTEQFLRLHNYPDKSVTKTQEDVQRIGIRAFMISNACAMYRRSSYDELGGFVTDTLFNEDMIFGAALLMTGGAIRYCAGARVYHTHNYRLPQQFRRSFDLAVSQVDHPGVFRQVSSEKEGVRYVKEAAEYCLSQKRYGDLTAFLLDAAARYSGFFLGKHYKMLPEKLVLGCTLQPAYWAKRKRVLQQVMPIGELEQGMPIGGLETGMPMGEPEQPMKAGCGDATQDYGETLKQLHALELSAVKAFLSLCERYQLRYYAIGGTLLGAVRHGGFIPWDDDVDVAMPRPDYDRLIELLKSGEVQDALGPDFVLESWQTDEEFKSYFAKIASTKYELSEALREDTTKRKGYLIDILPIDGTPESSTGRKLYYAKAMLYRFLCGTANVNSGIRTSRPKWEQTILRIVRALKLYRLLKITEIYRGMDRLFEAQDAEHAAYAGTLTGAYKTREIVPREYFGASYDEYSEWKFEDVTLRGPKKWEHYLTHMFGDYQKLPPVEERKVHYRPVLRSLSGEGEIKEQNDDRTAGKDI